jgi:beta-glucosidase
MSANDGAGSRSFPEGFRWGVATSAYQIEGAAREDGKGPSIWDTYAHTAGKIRNGDTGDVANDHYHRYRQDVALMRELGVDAYRFSIAWPRIFPDGVGEPNPAGVDFYRRLVDELLAAGIEPFPTLYHWDLPQALQDRGGWGSRDTAEAFADYAGFVAEQLGDRVTNFFTMNEFHSFIDIGYQGLEEPVQGEIIRIEHAPGLHLAPAELHQARHHAVLAQGLAVRAIHASGPPGVRCGPADNVNAAVPLIETPEHVRAAEIATRELNAPYLTVMLEGRYTDAYLEACGADAPSFTDEDLAAIASPVDFLGINLYRPHSYVVATDEGPGYRVLPFSATHPKMLSAWHLLGPEVMYWGPRHVHALWNPGTIYVTENGCGGADEPDPAGAVVDTDRVMFLRNHLTHLARATGEGIPVAGSFLWSFMDNFEWSDGFDTRFGLVHVDFETQTRTPKASADYYREVIAHNAVV